MSTPGGRIDAPGRGTVAAPLIAKRRIRLKRRGRSGPATPWPQGHDPATAGQWLNAPPSQSKPGRDIRSHRNCRSMIRFVFRFLGLWMLAAAFVFLIYD